MKLDSWQTELNPYYWIPVVVWGHFPCNMLCPLYFSFSSCHQRSQPHAELVLYLFLFLLFLQLNLWMETWNLTDFWQSSASWADEHSLTLGSRPTAGALLCEQLCSCVSKEEGWSPTLSSCCFEVMIYYQYFSHPVKGRKLSLPRLATLDMGGGHREHLWQLKDS